MIHILHVAGTFVHWLNDLLFVDVRDALEDLSMTYSRLEKAYFSVFSRLRLFCLPRIGVDHQGRDVHHLKV